ncbi:Sodium/hydrogen exchanger 10 [Pelomyxa schiedti]|nr:Sodium/hydrogen exchanger 10 [Pelomyxa schiedti]
MECTTTAMAVACVTVYLSIWLPEALKSPAVVMFVLALILGTIPSVWEAADALDPNVILLVFLPPVLFQSGLEIDFHVFKKVALQSIILAGPGVLVSAAVSTIAAYYLFVDYNWSWTESLLLGAALSATDPVATIATIKKLGASPKISVLIEGEALLNDGSAYVLFVVVYNIIVTNKFSAAVVFRQFCQLTLGGPLFGLACAYVTYLWLRSISRFPVLEISITTLAIFGAMLISAIVTFGLFMAYKGKYGYSPGTSEPNSIFWNQLEFGINALIFFFAGLIVMEELMSSYKPEFLNIFTTYVALQVGRGLALLLLLPILVHTGAIQGTICNPGAVLCTSVINGLLSKVIYPLLHFEKKSESLLGLFEHAVSVVELKTAEFVEELHKDIFLRNCDWEMIGSALPVLVRHTESSQISLNTAGGWTRIWLHHLRDITSTSLHDPTLPSTSMPPSGTTTDSAPSEPFQETQEEQGCLEALHMFINTVKANYLEQFEGSSHLDPSSVASLVAITDQAAEKSHTFFDLSHTIFSRELLATNKIVTALLKVPLLKYLGTYLLYKQIYQAIRCSHSLFACYSQATKTVLETTSVSFAKDVAAVQNNIMSTLSELRKAWPTAYALAQHSLALKMIMYHKGTLIRHVYREGFIDSKTKDHILSKLSTMIHRFGAFKMVWMCRELLLIVDSPYPVSLPNTEEIPTNQVPLLEIADGA